MIDRKLAAELIEAFVLVRARAAGCIVREVRRARTGSVYVQLEGASGEKGVVRIADHRTHNQGPRLFSVRVQAMGKLRQLNKFLHSLR